MVNHHRANYQLSPNGCCRIHSIDYNVNSFNNFNRIFLTTVYNNMDTSSSLYLYSF